MIIKPSDDKQSQIALLKSFLAHPSADTGTKKRIDQEIRNIQAGIRGEEEAAYEMKVHWGESKNWMIIHDLRIEYGELVAQIDHLIINRWMEILVCESKHFSEGIAINEHGEFSAFFGSKPYGLPSPIEQNNRHILILKRFFDSGAVKLPTRFGFTLKPDLKSLVLVSKHARITRPKAKIDGLDCIIKNDQLFRNIDKAFDDNNNPLVMAKLIGKDTLEELAREIARQHKPIQFNWAAKYGVPAEAQTLTPAPVAQPRISRKGKTVLSIEALSITVGAAVIACGLLWYNYTSISPSGPPMARPLPQRTSIIHAPMSPQQEMHERSRKQNAADDVFDKQYKEPAGCDNWQSDKQMVDCVNQRMRAKSKFLEAHPELQ